MDNRFKIRLLLFSTAIIFALALTQFLSYVQFRQLSYNMQKLAANINESNSSPKMYYYASAYAPGLTDPKTVTQVNLCYTWDRDDEAYIDVECEPWQEIGVTGWYLATRGDHNLIYCFDNTSPKATDCYFVTESVNYYTQLCHLIVLDRPAVIRCEPLGNKLYKSLGGDDMTLICNNSKFPVAKECSKYVSPD